MRHHKFLAFSFLLSAFTFNLSAQTFETYEQAIPGTEVKFKMVAIPAAKKSRMKHRRKK
jgi:hypothetical protein